MESTLDVQDEYRIDFDLRQDVLYQNDSVSKQSTGHHFFDRGTFLFFELFCHPRISG